MTNAHPSIPRASCSIAAAAALWLVASHARADTVEPAPTELERTEVVICTEMRLDGDCSRPALVPLEHDRDLAPLTREAADERRLRFLLQRGPDTEERAVLKENGRAPMEAGMEVDPALKWEVRHEFLLILAELAEVPGLRTFVTRYQMKPDLERVRAFRTMAELEQQRDRGSVTEIEERAGSESVSGTSTEALAAGTTLFVLGAALSPADTGETNTTHAKIRPKFGTPGIKLKGQFDFF